MKDNSLRTKLSNLETYLFPLRYSLYSKECRMTDLNYCNNGQCKLCQTIKSVWHTHSINNVPPEMAGKQSNFDLSKVVWEPRVFSELQSVVQMRRHYEIFRNISWFDEFNEAIVTTTSVYVLNLNIKSKITPDYPHIPYRIMMERWANYMDDKFMSSDHFQPCHTPRQW